MLLIAPYYPLLVYLLDHGEKGVEIVCKQWHVRINMIWKSLSELSSLQGSFELCPASDPPSTPGCLETALAHVVHLSPKYHAINLHLPSLENKHSSTLWILEMKWELVADCGHNPSVSNNWSIPEQRNFYSWNIQRMFCFLVLPITHELAWCHKIGPIQEVTYKKCSTNHCGADWFQRKKTLFHNCC